MLLLATLFGISPPLMATAAPPPPPDYMTGFACRVVEGHYDPGHPVYATPDWEDKDWAIDEDGLKVCMRWFFSIKDEAAKFDPSIKEMRPDTSRFFACNYIAMRMPYKVEIDGEDWYSYKFGCPRPIHDDKTDEIVGYTDPACPSDCKCVNEPSNI